MSLGLALAVAERASAQPPTDADADADADTDAQPELDDPDAPPDNAPPELDADVEPDVDAEPTDASPDADPDLAGGDLGAIDDGPDQPEAHDDPEPAEDVGDAAPIRPPRFDGPYVGIVAIGTANFVKVIDLDTPTPLFGTGGFVQAGDAVFPWMSIGIAAGGQAAWVGDQQMFEGALLVEFGFVPAKRYPLSIRTGFGFGGGAVTQAGIDRRFGYGGALFKGSVRYEFFPLAAKHRSDRGGGWAIGPELGWLGATPAGKGQPFVNTILLGLSTSFYFGS